MIDGTKPHKFQSTRSDPGWAICKWCSSGPEYDMHFGFEEDPITMPMQPVRARIINPPPTKVRFDSLLTYARFLDDHDCVCIKVTPNDYRRIADSADWPPMLAPTKGWEVRPCQITGIEVELR